MHLYRKLQTTPSSGVPRIRNRYDVSTCTAVHIEYKGSLFPTCFFLQGIVYLLWLLLHRYHQASLAAQRTGTFCSHPSCTKSLMILLEQRRTEINDYQSLIKIRSPIWLLHWKIAVLTLSKERGEGRNDIFRKKLYKDLAFINASTNNFKLNMKWNV